MFIEAYGLYTYPDAVVVCGDIERTDAKTETITNPLLIIEVLSPTTAAYDRSKKFDRYRSLESFCEYILILQDRPFIEHYRKNESDEWLIRFIYGFEAIVSFDSFEFELPLHSIYEYVEWDEN
ncbi:MAG: Uma2 family endonuclease [Chloroflexota bacterium]